MAHSPDGLDRGLDRQARVQRGKGQKGAIPIGKHSVILFNSDDPALAICNPTRTWRLTAESNQDAQVWGKLLHKVVHDCKIMETGAADPGTRFVQAIVAPDSDAPSSPMDSGAAAPVAPDASPPAAPTDVAPTPPVAVAPAPEAPTAQPEVPKVASPAAEQSGSNGTAEHVIVRSTPV
jgi:hypothetical protein